MTKEEAIKYLEKRKEKALMLMEESKADTPINNKVRGILTRKIEVLDMAISALSEELSEDGTLTVHVSDGSKVMRVFVMGDNIFGGLYYPDSAENKGDLISRQAVLDGIDKYIEKAQSTGTKDDFISFAELGVKALPSAFEGMTNNEVHKAIFGFELDPRYLVTDDNCIVGGEDCPACPLYNKICNNQNFAEWLDSPYKGVSE